MNAPAYVTGLVMLAPTELQAAWVRRIGSKGRIMLGHVQPTTSDI